MTAMTLSASRRREGRRLALPFGRILIPVAGAALVFGLWEAIVRVFAVPIYLVPAPSDVWTALADNREILVDNLWPTATEALLGFLLGNGVAILLAVCFVYSDLVYRAFYPVSVALRTVPIIAIAPVLVILFGNGLSSKVVIAALVCFFPTLVNMIVGLRSVDPQTIELMKVLSARPWEIFFKARWYAALPYLFSALEIAATSCVLGAIVGEWIGSEKGLGNLIIQATYDFRTPILYAAMAVSSALAVAAVLLVAALKKLVIRWK